MYPCTSDPVLTHGLTSVAIGIYLWSRDMARTEVHVLIVVSVVCTLACALFLLSDCGVAFSGFDCARWRSVPAARIVSTHMTVAPCKTCRTCDNLCAAGFVDFDVPCSAQIQKPDDSLADSNGTDAGFNETYAPSRAVRAMLAALAVYRVNTTRSVLLRLSGTPEVCVFELLVDNVFLGVGIALGVLAALTMGCLLAALCWCKDALPLI
jgi:hypothetical protein